MNLFDLLAIAVLVAAVLAGIRTGALPQIFGIGGALVGLGVALAGAPWLVDITASLEPLTRAMVVLAAILGLILVGEAIGSGVGHAIATALGRGVVSSIDRTVGGFVGAAQAVLIVWLVGGLLAVGPFPTLARVTGQSTAVHALATVLPPPTEIAGEIAAAIDDTGLPDVFLGLEPIPLPDVERPSDPEADRIAQAAAASTARVTSRACSSVVNGTGVVVAPRYLVTNAHVVAGAAQVRVDVGGSLADAEVVMFDPELDVALLLAHAVTAPALRFASGDPGRGETGAALGYEGGGRLVVLPAAVSGAYPATGRDIYGRNRVTRQILELRAAVEPGDSGGPLVLRDGTIGGLVFAESRTDPDVGYALSPTSVATAVAPAIGRTDAVSTGDCLD